MNISLLRKRVLEAGVAVPVLAMLSVGFAAPAYAQDPSVSPAPQSAAQADEPVILVTGSRLSNPNGVSNSPTASVSGEEAVAHADITVETFLNTLPAVNPAGTTTSNNPPNGGQANIDLRGLGSNRNLVLINGRRPMVSASDQTVDVNTIPQGLIDRIDVITGGAGAVYGADAVAGVVNFVLKRDFQGIEGRATYANTGNEDALEWQASLTAGLNFGPEGRGNIAISYEHAARDSLIKSERPFSQNHCHHQFPSRGTVRADE
ncbi:MAG: TonB-dependent receptor plug domain-containing protein [Croceibacterium sp.]